MRHHKQVRNDDVPYEEEGIPSWPSWAILVMLVIIMGIAIYKRL